MTNSVKNSGITVLSAKYCQDINNSVHFMSTSMGNIIGETI